MQIFFAFVNLTRCSHNARTYGAYPTRACGRVCDDKLPTRSATGCKALDTVVVG